MNEQHPASGADDHPRTAVKPPLLYAGAALAAWAAEAWLLRLPLGTEGIGPWVGAVLMAGGVGLALHCVLRFRRAGTNVQTWRPSVVLVREGPYRFSRNPIYIGLTGVYAGLALAADSLWMLILLPAVLAVLHRGVVLREEAYLEARFGDDYRAYKARTRRWL